MSLEHVKEQLFSASHIVDRWIVKDDKLAVEYKCQFTPFGSFTIHTRNYHSATQIQFSIKYNNKCEVLGLEEGCFMDGTDCAQDWSKYTDEVIFEKLEEAFKSYT